MPRPHSLLKRVGQAIFVQAALITLAAAVGVVAAQFLLERNVLRKALETEAEYFWEKRGLDGTFPAPDTRNLDSHLVTTDDAGALPEALREKLPGFHVLPERALAHVSDRGSQRLVLVLDVDHTQSIVLYFGLIPLVGVLVTLYLSSWLAYRASHRTFSPVARLVNAVEALDLTAPAGAEFRELANSRSAEHSVRTLAQALVSLTERIEAFVSREREFTRNASHELRTPLAVVRMAADLLTNEHDPDDASRVELARIRRAVVQMDELVETFLLLAREESGSLPCEPVDLNRVVQDELARNAALLRRRAVTVEHTRDGALSVRAPERVVSIVVGNLVRNAFTYTEHGFVRARVGDDGLVIEDSGCGMSESQVTDAFEPFYRARTSLPGHGIGLTVVKRLCDRFDWKVRVRSELGSGTTVTVRFGSSVPCV